MQGLALGAFVQGFDVVDRHYAGGAFDWLTPFSILTAFALVAGYVLLAGGWLIMKTDEALARLGLWRRRAALVTVAASSSSSACGRRCMHAAVAARWFTPANIVMLSPVPLVTAATLVAL